MSIYQLLHCFDGFIKTPDRQLVCGIMARVQVVLAFVEEIFSRLLAIYRQYQHQNNECYQDQLHRIQEVLARYTLTDWPGQVIHLFILIMNRLKIQICTLN